MCVIVCGMREVEATRERIEIETATGKSLKGDRKRRHLCPGARPKGVDATVNGRKITQTGRA